MEVLMGVLAQIVTKAVIIDPKTSKCLLIRRSSEETDGVCLWEGAGGKLEKGETPEQSVIREVFEETGLKVATEKLLYVSLDNYGDKDILFIVYLCKSDDVNITLSIEHTDYVWADKAECREMLCGGIAEDYIRYGVYDLEW